jgi:hypothetical protein
MDDIGTSNVSGGETVCFRKELIVNRIVHDGKPIDFEPTGDGHGVLCLPSNDWRVPILQSLSNRRILGVYRISKEAADELKKKALETPSQPESRQPKLVIFNRAEAMQQLFGLGRKTSGAPAVASHAAPAEPVKTSPAPGPSNEPARTDADAPPKLATAKASEIEALAASAGARGG